jgi:hypothetical protein
MTNKKLLVGILGILLVFSFVLAGCDHGGGGDDTDVFAGTWIGEGKEQGHTMVASDGSYLVRQDSDGLEFLNGTYTVTGNTITMKMVKINPVILGGPNGLISWADLDDTYKEYLENSDTFQITIDGDTAKDEEGAVGFKRQK